MTLAEQRANLVNRINMISDEKTLEMLSETLAFYTHFGNSDITDALDDDQMKQLAALIGESAEKDTVPEEEFKKLFARWNTP